MMNANRHRGRVLTEQPSFGRAFDLEPGHRLFLVTSVNVVEILV